MTRLKKTVLYSLLVLTVLAGSIEVLARYNMRQEQAARAYLGDQLYGQEMGRGDPVVLLAGLQASTEFWQHRFDPLARDHRLVFVDALGFGRSPWPDVRYTLDDHLGALRRTLVAKGATRKLTLVAHSFGTILAAYYAGGLLFGYLRTPHADLSAYPGWFIPAGLQNPRRFLYAGYMHNSAYLGGLFTIPGAWVFHSCSNVIQPRKSSPSLGAGCLWFSRQRRRRSVVIFAVTFLSYPLLIQSTRVLARSSPGVAAGGV